MADAETKALLEHIKDIGERTEEKLDQHIERDERINKEFVLPMWNHYQQQKGMVKVAAVLYTAIGGAIVAVIDYFTKTGSSHP